ncbi:MAG TPA: DUF429 domain-containing protein [Casimicrobiaceae bacterium]|nr:DUF429 domain-containing protein [Casimicrobiaceae bacterium]
MTPAIVGVDFTSAPRRAKPITVARGRLRGATLDVACVDRIVDWAGFVALLREPGPWVGGFDFPFGLPRELVRDLGWPGRWDALVRHYAALDRAAVERAFAAWRAPRPAGSKFAHRACDAHSRAHPSMKLVNPPVAWMLHEGAPRLLAAGVHMPAVHDGDRSRVALEAYPGLLVRRIGEHAGRRIVSYKSDAAARSTPERRQARRRIVEALERGAHDLGIAVALDPALRRAALADASGDTLDAIACAVQAAWGALRAGANYGLPARAADAEGWIVTA